MAPQNDDRINATVRVLMGYVRWIGLLTCSLAALGYAVIGNYNMTGLMVALAVLSWINIRRKRNKAAPTQRS